MIKVVIKEAILKIVFFSSERARAAIEKQEIWEDDASRNVYYELFYFFLLNRPLLIYKNSTKSSTL